MADLSNYSFTGRLGADAEVKSLPSGKSVMEMSVANNIGYGNYKKTNWFKVKVWGDKVKAIAPFFKKGSLVGGSGELSTEDWTSKDGSNKTSLIVTCTSVQILSSKKDSMNDEPDDVPEDAVF